MSWHMKCVSLSVQEQTPVSSAVDSPSAEAHLLKFPLLDSRLRIWPRAGAREDLVPFQSGWSPRLFASVSNLRLWCA